jgi:hypothetical protein
MMAFRPNSTFVLPALLQPRVREFLADAQYPSGALVDSIAWLRKPSREQLPGHAAPMSRPSRFG